jgi:hypothetical protein
MNRLTTWWRQLSPLSQLMWLGFSFRLLATIFSKGFGWSDDHFLIIEPAQNWADGLDNYWLPSKDDPSRSPQGHPLMYVGVNYLFLKALMFIGIDDPQSKMYVIRFIHAIWSLLIIRFGYKILLQYTDTRVAWLGGLALALGWIFPFLSVRNLAEFVCVPALLWATWLLVKEKRRHSDYFYAGLLLGLSFSMRFQVIIYAAGLPIAMLISRVSLRRMLLTLSAFAIVVLCTQGLQDLLIWKKPFAEFMSYVEYNLNNASNYGSDVWYMYPALLLGLLIPPLSFALFAGWLFSWKKMPYLFWPVFIFLLFHSIFPNKQERFITTILPSFIICGIAGMKQIYEGGKLRFAYGFISKSRYFVIALNSLLLIGLTLSYSKRHRCEAMYYLYGKNDSMNFMIEDGNKDNDYLLPPLYYYGKWPSPIAVNKTYTADSALLAFNRLQTQSRPGYVVFWQAENLESRVDSLRKRFPSLTYEATIDPSFIDKLLYWLNPLNDNQTAFIYKLKE